MAMPDSDATALPVIREYERSSDVQQLRACAIELQDYERAIDLRMPSGEKIADDYVADLHVRCHQHKGKIFVAEIGETIAGYVVLLTSVQSSEIEDGDLEFGLVADLLVRKDFRGTGLGRKLMDAAESFAKECGVRWLRIGVMAENRVARNLYMSEGYAELHVDLEKDLGNS